MNTEPTPDVTTEPAPQRVTIVVTPAEPEQPRARLLPCPRCRRVVEWPYIHTCDPGAAPQRA